MEQPGVSAVAAGAAPTPSRPPRPSAQRAAAGAGAPGAEALRRRRRPSSTGSTSSGEQLDEALRKAGARAATSRAGIDDRGLVLSLTSRHVVFEPDRAELSRRGQRVLDAVAPVLRGPPRTCASTATPTRCR